MDLTYRAQTEMKSETGSKQNKAIIILMLAIGSGLIGDAFPYTLKVGFFLIEGLCALFLVGFQREVKISFLDITWIAALCFVFFSTRTWNARTAVYNLCLLAGYLLFVCAKHYTAQIFRSFKIVLVFGIAAAFTTILQALIPMQILRLFSLLSSDLYQNAIGTTAAGRYLGVTNYAWNCVLFAVLGTGFIISCYNDKSKAARIAYVLTAFVLYITLILIGSRSSAILLPLCLYVAFVKKVRLKPLVGSVVAIIILCLAVEYILDYGYNSGIRFIYMMNKMINQFLGGETVDPNRAMLINRALDYFRGKPVLGIGWYEFSNQNIGILSNGKYSHVHNMYYQTLAENGILGSIFFFFPIIITYGKTIGFLFSRASKLPVNKDETVVVRFSVFFQTYLLIASWIHVTLYDPETIMLYILICGMGVGAVINAKKKIVKVGEYT